MRGEAGDFDVNRDITWRRRTEEALRQSEELRRYAARAETMTEITQALAIVSLDTSAILETIVQHTAEAIGDACVISLTTDDGRMLEPVAVHHCRPEARQVLLQTVLNPKDQPPGELAATLLITGQPLFMPVVPQTELRQMLSPRFSRYLDQVGISSLLAVPLHIQGYIVGALSVARDLSSSAYTEDDLNFLLDIADRVGLSLTSAQLFEQVQRQTIELEQRVAKRTAELLKSNTRLEQEVNERKQAETAEREQRTLAEALRDTTAALNSTLNLDEVLDRILTNVGRVVPHDVANIMLVEAGVARVVRSQGYAEPTAEERALAQRFVVAAMVTLQYMAKTQRPLTISDTQGYQGWTHVPQLAHWRSYTGAPILWDGQITGFLNLNSATPGFFTDAHAERLGAFADQAAIAIRNAQLFAQAQELATLQERQRLARELHDAVSQTLWSATLIADVLPDVWEMDPDKGRAKLQRLSQLTRGALAEMRTLLLELRPASLVEVDLDELLQQLIAASIGHLRAQVDFSVEGVCSLPSHVQVVFYRVAQEALNNIGRHARATQVEVRLLCRPEGIELTIRDDGRGFDRAHIPAGHLGLEIMRERTDDVGATLHIFSGPEQGTVVQVTWSYHTGGGRAPHD